MQTKGDFTMRKKIIMGTSVLFILTLLTITPPVSATDFAGYSFSDSHFAIEVDLVGDGTFINPDAENPDIVRDLLNSSVATEESNEPEDQQFYMAYMNKSGIETSYSALEKIEHDIKFSNLLEPSIVTVLNTWYPQYKDALDTTIFHVNATAPFQQLVQHYTTPEEEDVFVTNNFLTLIAYSAGPDDLEMDAQDELYIGYTFSVQELVEAVNDVLNDAGEEYRIGRFDFESNFQEIDGGYKFGIEYTNMFVLWQKVDVPLNGVDIFEAGDKWIQSETGGIIFGQDIVAASVLDSIGFDYEFKTQNMTNENTYVLGTVTTHYNIGETNFLVTEDDQTFIDDHSGNWTGDPFITAPKYTFDIPEDLKNFEISEIGLTVPDSVTIQLSDLAFYIGDDAKIRMKMANSFGLTVATATTSFGISVENPVVEDNTGETKSKIDIAMGGNTFFFTEFTDKKTYKLKGLDTIWPDIDPTTDRDVIIDVFDPSDWAITGVAKAYFAVEFALAYGFTLFIASKLTPELFNLPSDATAYLSSELLLYLTFTEFPEWFGGEIVHDPAYSAVAAMAATGEDTTTTTEGPGPGDGDGVPFPGFELLSVLFAIPALYALYRKRR